MTEKVVLENGLCILMENIPYLRSATLGIWVKAGTYYETEQESGIAHFIEHMVFKGTKNRTVKDIANEFDEVGGQTNAFTSKELICFYAKMLDTHVDKCINILADMVLNPLFDPKDIETEKNVVIEEVNLYEDSPEDITVDCLLEEVFKGSPLGTNILGTPESISSFNRDMLFEYMDRNFRSENIVIAISGSFDREDFLKTVEKLFGHLKSNGTEEEPKEIGYTSTILLKEKDIEQNHLCIAFPGIRYQDERAYALAVMNIIFGNGMSSRLFQKIREDYGLAYSVYSFNAAYRDAGIFGVATALNPENEEAVLNAVFEEMELMKAEGVSLAELNRSKEQLKANMIMSLESTSSRMNHIGKSQIMVGNIISHDEMIQKIDEVTLEDVHAITKQLFDFSKMSVSVTGKPQTRDFYESLKTIKK